MSTTERDDYDSHSDIEDKEFSAGRPPLGHDDPVEPNPRRDDPDEDEPEVEEPEEEPETETEPE
jgi:hypothetical protein